MTADWTVAHPVKRPAVLDARRADDAGVAPRARAFTAGAFRGQVYGVEEPDAALLAQLAALDAWRESARQKLSQRRDGVVRHEIVLDGVRVPVVLKTFQRVWWRDRDFARNGSKGARSFATAVRMLEHGAGTPRPIAWLDRWEEGKLVESHYLCAFEEGASFRDELDRLFREDPLCRRVLGLLEAVAGTVARMHEAGVCHMDLGKQNILLQPAAPDRWDRVRVIDLDRSRLHASLTLRQRARDLSRLDLPSALLPIFHSMYFGDAKPPAEFVRWESHYRRRYAFHVASRRYRHPFRELRLRREAAARGKLALDDLWLWDDRSEQAIGTRRKGDRYVAYPWRNGFHVVRGLVRGGLPVRAHYRDYLAQAFRKEVALSGRIGMSVGTSQAHAREERALLGAMGPMPALVRVHRHASDETNADALAQARRLKAAGHPIYLALVQDRTAMRDPAAWRGFVEAWLPRFADVVDQVEVGHAVNRVKWGMREFHEYRTLLEGVRAVPQSRGLALTGPAAIDFEYHYLAGLLDVLPEGSLDALSHHLYVDRRGAPENLQGRFSCVEKFALARAIAAWSPAVKTDRLIVSEANWPLADTGVHCPVAAPYQVRGARNQAACVDEATYADFMLRYYALALCSGLVDQVYWWRLIAHGFGLVDDIEATLRPRAAYTALRHFATLLGDATFVERMPADDGAWVLRFRRADGSHALMAWSHPTPVPFQLPFPCEAVLDRSGVEIPAPANLGASPVYFTGIR